MSPKYKRFSRTFRYMQNSVLSFMYSLLRLTLIMVVWSNFFLVFYDAPTCLFPFLTSLGSIVIGKNQCRCSNLTNKMLIRSMWVCLPLYTMENMKLEGTFTKNCTHRSLWIDLNIDKNYLHQLTLLVLVGIRGVISIFKFCFRIS